MTKREITDRFNFNLRRVENLVSIYETFAGSGQGRRSTDLEDILRAATVQLHATLEDFMRGIAVWKLPAASDSALDEIPLVGGKKNQKFQLGALAKHRGKLVDDLISESVCSFLSRESYSYPSDIKETLTDLQITKSDILTAVDALKPFMNRRHNIVHQADRETQKGLGYAKAKSISKQTVRNWIGQVRTLGVAVLNEL